MSSVYLMLIESNRNHPADIYDKERNNQTEWHIRQFVLCLLRIVVQLTCFEYVAKQQLERNC